MVEVLKNISNGIIIVSFLLYFILIIINSKKIITNSNGFDITKDVLQEYSSINIIENKGYFTIYNLKRKIIKIATNFYYGSSLSYITIPLIEASISAIDNNNKLINIFRKIVPNLKVLYILPILAILINNISYNISDAKVSIVLLTIFTIISYMLINIITDGYIWLNNRLIHINNLKKETINKIINYVNKIIFLNKLIFISELLIIIRCAAILLDIN